MATVKEVEKIAKRYKGNSLVEAFQSSKRLAEYGALSGTEFNAKHSRDHGKFASKPGGTSAPKQSPDKVSIHQQPEAGNKNPPQAHPSAIAKSSAPAPSGDHSSAMTSFNNFVSQHKISAVVAGAAVAAIGIAAATGNLSMAGKILGENVGKLKGVASSAIETARHTNVGASVGKAVSSIGEKFAAGGASISKGASQFSTAAKGIAQTAKADAGQIAKNISGHVDVAKANAVQVAKNISGHVETAGQDAKMLATHMKQNVTGAAGKVGDALNTAKTDANMIAKRTVNGIKDATATARQDGKMFATHMKQNVDAAASVAKDKIGTVARNVEEKGANAIANVKGHVNVAGAHVENALANSKNNFKDAGDAASNVAHKLGSEAKGATNSAISTVKGASASVEKAVGSKINQAKNAIETAKSAIGGAKDGASGSLNNTFAGNSPSAYAKTSNITGAGRKAVSNATDAVKSAVGEVKAAPGRARDAFRSAKNNVKAALQPKAIGQSLARGQENVTVAAKKAVGLGRKGAKAARQGGEGLVAGFKSEKKNIAIKKVMDSYPGIDSKTAEGLAFAGKKGANTAEKLAKVAAKAAPVVKKSIIRKVAKIVYPK